LAPAIGRQLSLERSPLRLATAAEGFGQRKTVELRQILQMPLMRGEANHQHGGDGKQNSTAKHNATSSSARDGALSGIGPVYATPISPAPLPSVR